MKHKKVKSIHKAPTADGYNVRITATAMDNLKTIKADALSKGINKTYGAIVGELADKYVKEL